MDSPQNRHLPQPHNPLIIEPLHLPIPGPPPIAPPQDDDPFGGPAPMAPAVNFNGQQYAHLPPALAQQVATMGVDVPTLATPQNPVNFNRYTHLPPALAQQAAAAPPHPLRRGRRRHVPLAVPQVSIIILILLTIIIYI